MKQLLCKIVIATTLLLSGCGSNANSGKIVKKYKCEGYSILEDLRVSCYLIDENYEYFNWSGVIDMWLVDKNTMYHEWYELSNGEHYLKVGVRQ